MEKVRLIEGLSDKEKQTIFSILDTIVGKKKLKDIQATALQEP